jgi:hypothetical protein
VKNGARKTEAKDVMREKGRKKKYGTRKVAREKRHLKKKAQKLVHEK